MQWCEIFKTGKYKDSKGNEREWTLADLQTMKQNYEEKNPDVPICCGHPKNNSPAYGWLDGLKIENNKENGFSLFSKFKNVQEDFKEAINKGLYKTRSISVTPDLMIRHLAFLGAQTPAIKKLEEFCFSENEDDIQIETNANDDKAKSVQTEPIGDEGVSSPPSQLKNDEQEPKSDNISELQAGGSAFSPAPPQIQNDENKGTTNMDKEQLQNTVKALKDENAELKKQLEAEKKAKQAQEFQDFCDKAIEKGNILPAQKNAVMDILTASSDYEPFEFSDGNTKTVPDMVKDLIDGMKQFDFKPVATTDKAGNNESIDFSDTDSLVQEIKKVQAEYKQKGIELNNLEALDKIERK